MGIDLYIEMLAVINDLMVTSCALDVRQMGCTLLTMQNSRGNFWCDDFEDGLCNSPYLNEAMESVAPFLYHMFTAAHYAIETDDTLVLLPHEENALDIAIDLDNFESKLPGMSKILVCYIKNMEEWNPRHGMWIIKSYHALCTSTILKKQREGTQQDLVLIRDSTELTNMLELTRKRMQDEVAANEALADDAEHQKLFAWVERVEALLRKHSKRGLYEFVSNLEIVQQEAPNVYICPITLKLMEDPVILSDGTSYEREAIERWLRSSDRSPKTNQPLPNKTMIPNTALKILIREYVEKKHQEYLEENAQPVKRRKGKAITQRQK
jgi:hypothetical protein